MLWALSVERDLDLGIQNDVNAIPALLNPPPSQASTESPKQETTLLELFTRYGESVTPLKRGIRQENARIKALSQGPLAKVRADELSVRHIANFRDERLKTVTGSTVCRELNVLSSILNHAKMEWGVSVTNPVGDIRRPAQGKARTRTLSKAEEAKLLQALETDTSEARNPWIKPLVELALETAMRRGELLALQWVDVDMGKRFVKLHTSKNGESREVPLSPKALEVLSNLKRTNGAVFPTTASAVEQSFRRAIKRASLVNFRFHDLRHSATSRLCRLVPNVVELSRITGHKTLGMLNRYYHVSAEELAIKLAGGAA
jgi:integrase